MTSLTKLLPCPFCGSTNVALGNDTIDGNYEIVCLGCAASLPAGDVTKEGAITQWNTRSGRLRVSDELDAATVERCAQVAIRLNGWGSPPRPDIAEHIASAIRSLIPNSAGAPSASHCGSPGESDPAVTQDCAPAGTVSARDLAIWLRDFRCGPLPGATLKPVVEKDRQLARALLSQFDIRRK